MTPHVPLFSLGTGKYTERLRNVVARLTRREVKLTEDVSASMVEALESIANRLDALERAASRRHSAGEVHEAVAPDSKGQVPPTPRT
jgi:hypothetical protein